MSVFWQSPCLPSVSHHVSLLAVTMSAFNPLEKKVGFWSIFFLVLLLLLLLLVLVVRCCAQGTQCPGVLWEIL